MYRQLPQLGQFLEAENTRELLARYPRSAVAAAARAFLASARHGIASGCLDEAELAGTLAGMHESVRAVLETEARTALREVVNATGVVLQTNLGRAPLSAAAIEAMADVARGYCNLEYDLDTGERGLRGGRVESLLLRVLGCEEAGWASLVVNNCAAATLLALNSLADGGEVIVSRGELVEIGGGFRVPEILRKSGARLREVGTTNRTRIEDYSAAITPQTRLILRVHRSNFEIVGFTQQPAIHELVELGARSSLPVMEDQGTGCLIAPADYNLGEQLTFAHSVHSGVALVCASGDKLLGGPQCGLLAGTADLMARLRRNPLYRALRVDKLTYAALQATLQAYEADAPHTIPVLRMLALGAGDIRARCEAWEQVLQSTSLRTTVVACESVVGGGATHGVTLPSFAMALEADGLSANDLWVRLRRLNPPVIGRIHEGSVLLDLRTVPERFDALLPQLIRADIECAAQLREHEDQP